MADDRTPEQREADEDLERAIRRAVTAHGWEGLATDWIVIAAVQSFDRDGDGQTTIGRLMPGGRETPWYRAMGLLDVALSGFRNEIRDEASFREDGRE